MTISRFLKAWSWDAVVLAVTMAYDKNNSEVTRKAQGPRVQPLEQALNQDRLR